MEQEMEEDLLDRIRERAYEIWIASGYRDDEAEQHWLTAEREILSALQSAALVEAPAKRIRGRTIRPFLARQAFEPEAVRNMSLAFDSACEALGLRTREDPATTRVAEKVIELAQRGIRDVATLRAMTLKEFNREEIGPLSWRPLFDRRGTAGSRGYRIAALRRCLRFFW